MLSQWSGDHGGIVTCCEYSHDGHYIVTGSDLDFAVRIWDAHDGTLIHDIKGESKSCLLLS